MARAKIRATTGEKRAGYGVLAVLAAVAVWLFLSQAQFNPAVIVAMNHPKGAGRLLTGQQAGASSQTASYLADLQGYSALSGVESYTPETLSDKIDGKAELYLASGFQEMSCRSFSSGDSSQARVETFLYAMESPKDAFAVFSGQRRQGALPLALSPNAYATENAVFLTSGRFYIELVADKATPEIGPALEALAQSLLSVLPRDDSQPADADLFPATGLRKDSLRLAVTDALGMEGLENVYTAEYSLPGGEAAAFLAVRATAEEAAAQAKAYTAFLAANGFKQVKAPAGLAGVTVMALDNLAQVVMSRGRILAGVHDAASAEAALELAALLTKFLEGKQP
ncbi:MAG: hypothetical protein HY795_05280 [Desulfovibrio sp.]|nr:hypothetical protein [Desulfovibrio sp.]MBI4959245.1 hypothetical protein [Desulfovibrio sp.]